jgi:pyruvate dehydrogenase E2 component (dihydrolipoamide acetyltransferase)
MPYEVKLPDIGEGIAEGEIVRWLVKAGDKVREDQPLVEVMTDKASVEIPSPRTGIVGALLAEEGQVVPVGSVIVSIETEGNGAPAGAAPAAHATAKAATAPVAAPAPAAAPTTRVQATPAVRQLAKQLGVALEGITGSGPGGTINAADVEAAAKSGAGAAGAGASPPSASTTSASDENSTRVPMRGLRRKIADAMRRSIQTAAHYTFVAECDMTAVAEHREATKPLARAANVKLTYMAYIVRALIEPLQRFPLLNASLDDERQEIVLKGDHHIGIATSTDEGLTVPVVRDAGRRTLFDLAREIERLAEAARMNRLKLDELQGGTFTVTSTGAHGGVLATPILHHPQVAILGVHEMKPRPAVKDGQIVIRNLGNLSLSLDHRVVDGAVGADFLYALIERLEHPETWLTAEDVK